MICSSFSFISGVCLHRLYNCSCLRLTLSIKLTHPGAFGFIFKQTGNISVELHERVSQTMSVDQNIMANKIKSVFTVKIYVRNITQTLLEIILLCSVIFLFSYKCILPTSATCTPDLWPHIHTPHNEPNHPNSTFPLNSILSSSLIAHMCHVIAFNIFSLYFVLLRLCFRFKNT